MSLLWQILLTAELIVNGVFFNRRPMINITGYVLLTANVNEMASHQVSFLTQCFFNAWEHSRWARSGMTISKGDILCERLLALLNCDNNFTGWKVKAHEDRITYFSVLKMQIWLRLDIVQLRKSAASFRQQSVRRKCDVVPRAAKNIRPFWGPGLSHNLIFLSVWAVEVGARLIIPLSMPHAI